MSDDPEHYMQWWKKEKALSLARKARAKISASGVQPGDTFLIVTEGAVTEPEYLRQIRAALQLQTVQVRICPGSTPNPMDVIATAARLAKAQKAKKSCGLLGMTEPEKFDHVWAVIDTDVSQREGTWPAVVAFAAKEAVKLASSTPCIEFWLFLHIRYGTPQWSTGAEAKAALASELDVQYDTNFATTRQVIEELLPKWPEAIRFARQVRLHHKSAGSVVPATPSTDVDYLVEALNYSAPQHLRR